MKEKQANIFEDSLYTKKINIPTMPCIDHTLASGRVAGCFSCVGPPHAATEYLQYQHNRRKGTWRIRRIITTTKQDGPIVGPVKCICTSFDGGERQDAGSDIYPVCPVGTKPRHTIQCMIKFCLCSSAFVTRRERLMTKACRGLSYGKDAG